MIKPRIHMWSMKNDNELEYGINTQFRWTYLYRIEFDEWYVFNTHYRNNSFTSNAVFRTACREDAVFLTGVLNRNLNKSNKESLLQKLKRLIFKRRR